MNEAASSTDASDATCLVDISFSDLREIFKKIMINDPKEQSNRDGFRERTKLVSKFLSIRSAKNLVFQRKALS